MMRLRGVRRGMVNGIRIEVRTKNLRRKAGATIRILGVTITGIYITTKGWIHCGRVGMYGRFRGDRGGNYR